MTASATAVALLLIQAAVPVPVAPAGPPAVGPALGPEQLSPAGRAIVLEAMRKIVERQTADEAPVRATAAAIERAVTARPVNIAALRTALEARDALALDRVRARTGDTIALLKRLDPADREVVLRLMPRMVGLHPPGDMPFAPPAPPPR